MIRSTASRYRNRTSRPSRHDFAVRQGRKLFSAVEPLESRMLMSGSFLVSNLNDSGLGSLRDAITQVNADTTDASVSINFDPTVFTGVARTITLASSLTLNPTNQSLVVAIDATPVGGVTINGGGTGTVLTLSAGAISLTDLTLTNGNARQSVIGNGGGIYNAATLNLTNCTISGNDADGVASMFGGGGAGIYNAGTLTILDSTISGNQAFGSNNGASGGGILNAGSLTLTNSTIANNSSANSGGGIYFAPGSHATLVNNTITGNGILSFGSGAGVYNDSGGAISMTNTIVADNAANGDMADSNGSNFTGGFDIIGDSSSLSNLTNSSNSQYPANLPLAPLNYYGGPTQTVALLGLPFFGTTAGAPATDQRGFPRGEIVDIGAFQPQSPDVNSLVTTANDPGVPGLMSLRGAIDLANLQISSTTITFAQAYNIQLTLPSTLYLNNTNANAVITIDATSADGATVNGGGALSNFSVFEVDSGTVDLTDLTVSNGSTINSGGGLYNDSTVALSNCTFTNDSAGEEGGGLDNEDNLTADNCLFTNDTANYGGGFYNDATMNISDSTITGNSLTGTGGGAGFGNEGLAIVTNCIITNNTGGGAGDVGGGILNYYLLTLSGDTVSSNVAANNGGGIDDEGTTLTAANCVISGNSAANGGGVYSDATTTLTACQVSGNSSTATGGGISDSAGSNLSIATSTISANSAVSDGGGIYNLGTLTVADSTLTQNTATGNGGGIYSSGLTSAISASTITANSALDGGGIFVSGSSPLTVTDSTITGNSATIDGGGIGNEGDLVLAGSIVSQNQFTGDGAGPDISGGITTDNGYNLLGTALAHSTAGTGDVFTDTPLLGALANNGGPTQTMALLGGSLALNAGNPTDISLDQRGTAVQGGVRDIGAFESLLLPQVITFTNSTSVVTYPLAPIVLTATSGASGNPVIFTIFSGPATIDGAILTVSGPGVVVVKANQAGNNQYSAAAAQTLTLTVDQPPAITSADQTTFTTGVSGTFIVQTTGFPGSILSESGALPAGVTFTDNGDDTATISGVPTAFTGGIYVLTLNDGNGVIPATSQIFELIVDQAPTITSADNTTFTTTAPGTFTVSTLGFPTPVISEVGGLPTGVSFINNGNGTATLAGVPAAGTGGTYDITMIAAPGLPPGGPVLINGLVPTGGGGFTTQSFTLTVDQPPVITSADQTTFTTGLNGTFIVQTTGFPDSTLSESGALPAGVTFTDNGDDTATISGVPADGTGNAYMLTLHAANGIGGPVSQTFTLTVDQPPLADVGVGATFNIGTVGAFNIITSGFPLPALSVSGALPAGVTFIDNGNGTGSFSGDPAAGTGGVYELTLTSNDGILPPVIQSFPLTIIQSPSIVSPGIVTFTAGIQGSFLIATVGAPAVTILESGSLPPGMTYTDNHDGTATISGAPLTAAVGLYPLTLTVSNGVLPNATQTLNLIVQPSPVLIGSGVTKGSLVLSNPNGTNPMSITPFVNFPTIAIRVALATFGTDGVPDIIVTQGFGGKPRVKVFSGVDGHLIESFLAFQPNFDRGLFVAVADVNGDGTPDIIVGKGQGSTPKVRVFDGVTGAMIANFMAFPVSFTGGVRVAAADVNGDGDADIIAGEGPGTGGPLVSVFSGRAVLQGNDTPLSTFQAFNDSYTGGVFVAAGDVVSNSRADVVVGMGGDGPPLVEVFNGNSGILLDSFLAFDASFTGGVRVAVGALDANGLAEIIAGAGAGGQSQVNIFSGPDNTLVESIASNDPNYPGGVYVAGIGS